MRHPSLLTTLMTPSPALAVQGLAMLAALLLAGCGTDASNGQPAATGGGYQVPGGWNGGGTAGNAGTSSGGESHGGASSGADHDADSANSSGGNASSGGGDKDAGANAGGGGNASSGGGDKDAGASSSSSSSSGGGGNASSGGGDKDAGASNSGGGDKDAGASSGGGGDKDAGASSGGGGDKDAGKPTGPACEDQDGDGYGKNCAQGNDCDDHNPNFTAVCPDCSKAPWPGCPCSKPATNCYSGDPAKLGKGKCQAGVQLCKKGYWGECKGEVLPSPEVCDGADNNCNGLIDEGVLSSCGTCDMSCTLQQVGPDYGNPFDTDGANGVSVDKHGYLVLDATKSSVEHNNLWVANSPEATISKIDTKTGHEVGRYKICSNPSRTSVDLNGDVWVGCRGDGGVVKIIADTKKCIDKNHNGVIDTSIDKNGDFRIQSNERVNNDECIKFIVYPDGHTIARAAGVDKENHAWIGFWTSKRLRRLEPNAGKTVATSQLMCSPYGLVIDQKGIIWVQGAGCGLVRVDPKNPGAPTKLRPPFGYSAYGINVDAFGGIWFGGGWGAVRYNPVTHKWLKANGAGGSSAVATSTDGYTYIVNDGPSTVTKINSVTGTVQGKISLGSGRYPHGVALDYDGYVWAVNRGKGSVSKCDPKKMKMVGEYPTGPSPYTYSDMTGYTLNNFTAPKGNFSHVFGMAGWGGTVNEAKVSTVWERIDAQVETPGKSFFKIRYRGADTLAALKKAKWSPEHGPFPPAAMPMKLNQVKARFLEVEVFMQADQKTKASPRLKALQAKGKQTYLN